MAQNSGSIRPVKASAIATSWGRRTRKIPKCIRRSGKCSSSIGPGGKPGARSRSIPIGKATRICSRKKAKTSLHTLSWGDTQISAGGITLAEFAKIIQSLHPIRDTGQAAQASSAASLKIHPKVFNLIDCWISDSESPVVTEINLDAVDKNGNEFNDDGLKQEDEWMRCPMPDTNGGFMRYRVLESKGNHYKIEYQENGGGTLTTASLIEFAIEEREMQHDGKTGTIRVLRVLSHAAKE